MKCLSIGYQKKKGYDMVLSRPHYRMAIAKNEKKAICELLLPLSCDNFPSILC